VSVCEAYRDRLLDAEPSELRADASTDLADHVRGCAGCRAAAGEILRADDALAHALAGGLAAVPPLDAAAVVANALATRTRLAGAAGGAPPGDRSGAPVERRGAPGARARWIALAAAASIAALFLLSRRESRLPGVELAARLATPVTVEAPADRNVAVIPTTNPDITVLWFF
jgi:hypothetical protein